MCTYCKINKVQSEFRCCTTVYKNVAKEKLCWWKHFSHIYTSRDSDLSLSLMRHFVSWHPFVTFVYYTLQRVTKTVLFWWLFIRKFLQVISVLERPTKKWLALQWQSWILTMQWQNSVGNSDFFKWIFTIMTTAILTVISMEYYSVSDSSKLVYGAFNRQRPQLSDCLWRSKLIFPIEIFWSKKSSYNLTVNDKTIDCNL